MPPMEMDMQVYRALSWVRDRERRSNRSAAALLLDSVLCPGITLYLDSKSPKSQLIFRIPLKLAVLYFELH
jgi:hypothetical protein